jgi:hypothetical protein
MPNDAIQQSTIERWHAFIQCMAGTISKKRKAPSQALRAAQLQNTYVPFKRTRLHALSATEVSKLEAALSNEGSYGWTLTSNLRIVQKHNFYNIVLSRRDKADSTNGKPRFSSRYADQNSAEKAAFDFRYSNEARTGKRKVDDWFDLNQKILNGVFTVTPTEVVQSYDLSKKAIAFNYSGARKKSVEMSASIKYLESSNIWSRNPCNRSNNMTVEEFLDKQATTIQKCLKGRALRRAANAMRRLATDQTYRKELMLYLGKLLAIRDGLALLVGAEDPEIAATYTESDRLFVLEKARHLYDALRIMITSTEEGIPITWLGCCELSAGSHFHQFTGRTIMKWYLQLHERRETKKGAGLKWMRSSRGRYSRSAKSPFSEDESLMVQFKSWARSDLETLTVNKAQAWVNKTLLKDWSAEDLDNSKILFPVSRNIAARWMLEAGFKYERHKKSYYVDRHEDTDVLADRNKYIAEFFEEEILEHCWMQLSKRLYLHNKNLKTMSAVKTTIKQERRKAKDIVEDVSAAVTKYLDTKSYHYKNKAGEDMVEVHADWLYSYADEKLPNGILPLPKYGGNLSVRRPENVKPRVTFGQDEAIFRSSQLNESCWAIDGQQTLQTKLMGAGRMVSALCSREFGFGLDLSAEQLGNVNEVRRSQKYGDEDAAIYLLGSADKKDLLSSPFVRYLEYGKGKDGYWSYNHMVLQLEDCTDVFKVLFPQFDVVFELDHSSGHDKEKADGLTTTPSMLNWEHGGKQRSMRPSELGIENTGTVRHDRCINLGEIQHMSFGINDLPPVLKPLCPKIPTPTGKTITRALNVAEMKVCLETEKLNSDGKRQVLLERCIEAGLPVLLTSKVMTPGYVGEPKGAAHIAFERGFFDSSLKLPNGKKVSFAGSKLQAAEAAKFDEAIEAAATIIDHRKKKKPKVKRDKETSVREILKGCQDFANETPQLEYIAQKHLGAFIRLTPKCHPEIAGRGIEYAWGYAKLRFRRGINDAVASHLEENVKAALSREVLTISRMRKFARKARDYKLTYSYLVALADGEDASAAKGRIEHLTKLFKQHRSALDADYKFIADA